MASFIRRMSVFSPKSLSAKEFGWASWCVLSHSPWVLDPSILSHFDDWTWPRLEWDSNWKMHGSNATNGLSWLETLKKHGIAGSKLTHSLQRPLCVVFLVEFLLTKHIKHPAISWLSYLWTFWWCFVPSFVVPGCIAMCDSVALKTLFEAQGMHRPFVFLPLPNRCFRLFSARAASSPKSCSHARLSANFLVVLDVGLLLLSAILKGSFRMNKNLTKKNRCESSRLVVCMRNLNFQISKLNWYQDIQYFQSFVAANVAPAAFFLQLIFLHVEIIITNDPQESDNAKFGGRQHRWKQTWFCSPKTNMLRWCLLLMVQSFWCFLF